MSDMKAGLVGEKQTESKKKIRISVQKTEKFFWKSYKSANYPDAVSETPVHLRQHHTTDQHQGRRSGVVF